MREGLPAQIVEALARLPEAPGCYRYYDAGGTLLYVGKARSLRPRVRSYFQPSAQHAPKTLALVAETATLDFIVVSSEVEALILESNLIKQHHPRYNILLRDDKSFPYLKLTSQDPFPRVNLVRRPKPDGNQFYGPFLPSSHAWRTLRMIPRFFQVANCQLPFDGKQRPCLYYHLNQCLAPCAGKADPIEYAERVSQARLFLEGRHDELAQTVTSRMKEASDALQFERAAHYRDMLGSLEFLSQKQGMISSGLESIDFWAEYREGEQAALEVFQMRDGKVINRREFTFETAPDAETFYDALLPQFYAGEEPPPEIVLPRWPQDRALLEEYLRRRRGSKVALRATVQGETRRFLDVVAQNAQLAFEARFRQQRGHGVEVLEALRTLLGLDEPPFRIEGFDISHTQGTEPRASMVVFEGGKPKKADYRIFRVKVAEAGDDYAAMREVVGRRYARLQREGKRLPDLILIDGGKGQLGAARAALEEVGVGGVPFISLAKQQEEIFLPGREAPLRLDRHDPALYLIQQVRDEAHRFALSRHRRARGKPMRASTLTKIDGIGAVLARRLLVQFGSVEGVRLASDEALCAAIGRARAAKLRAALAADGTESPP